MMFITHIIFKHWNAFYFHRSRNMTEINRIFDFDTKRVEPVTQNFYTIT